MPRFPGNRRPHHSSLSWTDDQHDDLRDLAAARMDPRVIARVLNRSEKAVREYAKKRGIALLTEAEARRRRNKWG